MSIAAFSSEKIGIDRNITNSYFTCAHLRVLVFQSRKFKSSEKKIQNVKYICRIILPVQYLIRVLLSPRDIGILY